MTNMVKLIMPFEYVPSIKKKVIIRYDVIFDDYRRIIE